MEQVVPTPAVEFSLVDVANAMLVLQPLNHTPSSLADLLLEQAVADAAQGEHEDAREYALLAAQLIVAYNIELAGR